MWKYIVKWVVIITMGNGQHERMTQQKEVADRPHAVWLQKSLSDTALRKAVVMNAWIDSIQVPKK